MDSTTIVAEILVQQDVGGEYPFMRKAILEFHESGAVTWRPPTPSEEGISSMQYMSGEFIGGSNVNFG